MRASVAERCKECNSYCQHSRVTKLPVQEIQKGSAKCLILLGPRGQKMRKMDLTVELGGHGNDKVIADQLDFVNRGDGIDT